MKKKYFLFGILAITLLFGLAVVGCDDDNTKEGDGTAWPEKTLSIGLTNDMADKTDGGFVVGIFPSSTTFEQAKPSASKIKSWDEEESISPAEAAGKDGEYGEIADTTLTVYLKAASDLEKNWNGQGDKNILLVLYDDEDNAAYYYTKTTQSLTKKITIIPANSFEEQD